ncbi:MAG TPA: sodium-dependent transporter [Ruminococcaceae bacterium]|nr:sodium-dependent transporter [Oscillospiraceae bacterium]HCK50955.1 sodium-dependent transporter [Oscillospiraceae bacterium]
MGREKLGSRLGFILLSAGCAIGIGNVWKFPYVVGQNGGGVFVLIYLIFLAILGIPVLSMEFAIGRAAQKSPVKMYQELEPKGTVWHIHGKAAMIGGYLLMMFYTTVAGWMVRYFVSTAAGDLSGLDASGISQKFNQMLSDAPMMILYMGIVIVAAVLVCSIGLKNGLERVTKVMMLALLGIMVILAINSFFMPSGEQGIAFYLMPNFEEVQKIGIGTIIVNAMNQAFFTLSLGIGAMAIFGSYIGKERSLLGESVNVAILDTLVALSSGLIIFPACFAYGVDVDSGPSLIFITLPNIFNNLPLGRLWGSLFFVFMSFAALSTVLAVFEEITACTQDLFGWGRKKSCIVNGILLFVLSLPCSLGFNLLSFIQPLGEGTNIMDLEDFIVSNLILPLGSLVIILFCVLKKGWGWDNYIKEANTGKGLKMKNFMRGYVTCVLPIMVIVLFVIGIIRTFAQS